MSIASGDGHSWNLVNLSTNQKTNKHDRYVLHKFALKYTSIKLESNLNVSKNCYLIEILFHFRYVYKHCCKMASTHDSFIFTDSQIGQQLNTQCLVDGLLLVDSGYPCKPYLMTPHLNPGTNKQTEFNNAHTRRSVAIEHATAVWKRRFHLLHSQFRMNPEKVCMMIGACAVLHNIAILRKEPLDGRAEVDDQPDPIYYHGPEDGKVIRDLVCNTFF